MVKRCWEIHFPGLLTRTGVRHSLCEGCGRPGGASYMHQEESGGGGGVCGGGGRNMTTSSNNSEW
jgi:hypothetical protein